MSLCPQAIVHPWGFHCFRGWEVERSSILCLHMEKHIWHATSASFRHICRIYIFCVLARFYLWCCELACMHVYFLYACTLYIFVVVWVATFLFVWYIHILNACIFVALRLSASCRRTPLRYSSRINPTWWMGIRFELWWNVIRFGLWWRSSIAQPQTWSLRFCRTCTGLAVWLREWHQTNVGTLCPWLGGGLVLLCLCPTAGVLTSGSVSRQEQKMLWSIAPVGSDWTYLAEIYDQDPHWFSDALCP